MRDLHKENASFASDVNGVAQLAQEWLQAGARQSPDDWVRGGRGGGGKVARVRPRRGFWRWV